MIQIKNLNHIYKSKSGESVKALSDVSYTFTDTGMYFITGKSGSGKSTLLNLLGGLDKISEGDIVIDGDSLRGQSQKGFNNYRNTYAGLIFQEFNLIDGFTVYDNMDLPLKLQGKNNNNKQIAECLERIGLAGYEKRYPSELSGGQKQRIAIARQLAKGSKLMLADEPTGNLDEENGKIVLDILKKLSKEVLVIVVSHDIEAAKEYGDEIITLVDGRIKESASKELVEIRGGQGIQKTKNKFSTKYAQKIVVHNIRRKKIRFSVAVFLSVAALTLFAVFRTLTIYEPEKAMAHTLINQREQFVTLFQANRVDENFINKDVGGAQKIPRKVIDTIEGKNIELVKLIETNSRFQIESTKIIHPIDYHSKMVAIVNDAEHIKNSYGYELYSNSLPLTADSIYITDFYAQGIINSEYYYKTASDDLIAIPESYDISDLIGKTIIKSADPSKDKLKIAGIIKTDYKNFIKNLDSYSYNDIEYLRFAYLMQEVYNTLFVSNDYINSLIFEAGSVVIDDDFFSLSVSGKHVSLPVYINNEILNVMVNIPNEKVILTHDNLITDFDSFNFTERSAIVSLEIYNQIFNDNRNKDYYVQFTSEFGELSVSVLRFPQHIGETVNIKLYSADGELLTDLGEIKIIGVLVEEYQPSPSIYLYSNNFGVITQETLLYDRIVLPTDLSKSELTSILSELRKQDVFVYNQFSVGIYELEDTFNTMSAIFGVFSIVLLAVSVIMFANFTGVSIADRRKDIGIIRAMGGSSKNVFKIFFIEGLFFVIITSILTFGITVIATIVINATLAKQVVEGAGLIFFDFYSLLFIPLISFVSMLVASFIPLRKINKMSPIDIIKAK